MESRASFVAGLLGLSLVACQKYTFVYQPNSVRQGIHLRFVVEQPSKADVLFVIDNSGSMGPRQAALKASISHLLDQLAPQHTNYRIGITSTDEHGAYWDCLGQPLSTHPEIDPADIPGALGNCQRPEVELRRPHDGARGRLIAAYDPEELDPENPGLASILTTDAQRTAFAAVIPTGPETGPVGTSGVAGVPWVIDREFVQEDACDACEATAPECAPASDGTPALCIDGSPCFRACAGPVATALVAAYFRSNVSGLGIDGSSYESGLGSAARALGIDPEEPNDTVAVTPENDLGAPGGPNSFTLVAPGGTRTEHPWVRDDAMLALLLVSDEQDCSMPGSVFWSSEVRQYEDLADPPQPQSSICYQHGQNGLPDPAGTLFYPPDRIARLVGLKKGSSSRVAAAFIGGLRQSGPASQPDAEATPSDCVSTSNHPLGADGQPVATCTCVGSESSSPDPLAWCQFTENTSGPSSGLPLCDAESGSRYVSFVDAFASRTFDSICRGGGACETDAECDGLACIANQCARPCHSSADCGSSSSCAGGACVRSCATAADCDLGKNCFGGVCSAGYGPALTRFADIAGSNCFDLEGVTPAHSDPAYIQVEQTPPDASPRILPLVVPGSGQAGWYFDAVANRICLSGVERLPGDAYDVFVLTEDMVDAGS